MVDNAFGSSSTSEVSPKLGHLIKNKSEMECDVGELLDLGIDVKKLLKKCSSIERFD